MDHPQVILSQVAQEIDRRECEIGTLKEQATQSKLRIAFNLAGLVYGVEMAELRDRKRVCRRITEARQVAMYLANVTLQVGYCEIGAFVNRNRGTVRYGIERVEDRRENEVFDALIESLERLIFWITSDRVAEVITKGVAVDYDAGDIFARDRSQAAVVNL